MHHRGCHMGFGGGSDRCSDLLWVSWVGMQCENELCPARWPVIASGCPKASALHSWTEDSNTEWMNSGRPTWISMEQAFLHPTRLGLFWVSIAIPAQQTSHKHFSIWIIGWFVQRIFFSGLFTVSGSCICMLLIANHYKPHYLPELDSTFAERKKNHYT